MTTKQILKSTKNNTWTNANFIIQNSGLDLKLIEDLPFMKVWRVNNHNEIHLIINTMKYCGENIASVGFTWKD